MKPNRRAHALQISQDYRQLIKQSNHKYNAQPTEVDGIKFDSKAESIRYSELVLLQRAGHISNLQIHPTFELQKTFIDVTTGKTIRAIKYEADFSYIEAGKVRPVVEDVKGFETKEFSLKKKMFLYHYPQYELRIIK